MAQIGQLLLVSTNPATQFIAGLAQNAALTLNMTGGDGIGEVDGSIVAGKSCKARLKSIAIQSVENLAWEVWLWRKDTFNVSATDPALNFPAGRWSFVANDGIRIAAAGLYYYYIEGLDHFYVDLDRSGELHVMLVNRSAAAKTAGANGAIGITFAFENTQGF